ncbi:MAG: baseplate J/gp47 family protein [Anaeromicrobium sp.]|jgi:uncharacterized phage protein gp47/JayE|uniref:baseplate J/gp47 family protein n=1 Tax=Anaeromicrobium sp. TaxID=1929132 RepID=UPI0025FD15A7|nr:baseplate J/gp47 family protein [Anaeromicrobium sp.]MCT4593590.1 baseplate J/gp47 family protein [Anaeromicrobium sp.]
MTSEHIVNRILKNIEGDYDKSEGGFLYDLVKAVSLELSSSYEKQDRILDNGFALTASDNSLDKKVAEQGIRRKASKQATTTVVFHGEEGAKIPKGTKVSTDVVSFITLEEKTIGQNKTIEVSVECEIPGTIGNVKAGRIKHIPVTITGVSKVNNPNNVENGYDEEVDEELRQRYLQKVRTPGTSGNKYHYINWAKEVPGVKEVQVESPSPGQVLVTIIDTDMRGTGSKLENDDSKLTVNVKNHIDEKRPIGATVQVNLAAEVTININVKIVINTGLDSVENIKANIFKNIEKYIKDKAYYEGYVSKSKIGSAILDTYGVVNYSNLLIPGLNEDEMIVIQPKTVPILGGITYDQVKEQSS